MQASTRERLEKAGIDVSDALERFMGNDMLLERYLKKFLNNPNLEVLTTAIAAGEHEAALNASHALKGVCGNLAMTELFDLLTAQVAAFRQNNWKDAVELMPEISKRYTIILAAIRSME